jgi:hypothetical protein
MHNKVSFRRMQCTLHLTRYAGVAYSPLQPLALRSHHLSVSHNYIHTAQQCILHRAAAYTLLASRSHSTSEEFMAASHNQRKSSCWPAAPPGSLAPRDGLPVT